MRLLFILLMLALPTHAKGLRVVTDIAPLHSLAAMVMGDTGTPHLLLDQSTDPHNASLRPTQARALQDAHLVIHTGAGLAPWLERAVARLSESATVTGLMDLKVTKTRALRDNPDFLSGHDHAHDHQHDHDHPDPHGWLDPVNAQAWLKEIAASLAALNPGKAATYEANANAAAQMLEQLDSNLKRQLRPHEQARYVVLHDAFSYFEARYGLTPVAALSLSDASPPGAAWVQQLADLVHQQEVVCIFSEPQANDRLIDRLVEGSDIRRGVLDPLGVSLEPGAGLYPALLADLAEALVSCLSDETKGN